MQLDTGLVPQAFDVVDESRLVGHSFLLAARFSPGWTAVSAMLRGMRGVVILCLFALQLSAQEPRFSAQNELLLPAGYREWVFVGSSLGMSYNEGPAAPAKRDFHHVYLQPEAYRQYRESGKFPEGTMLVMEVYSAGSKASINRQGSFSDEFLRVEAAVKDSKRWQEGWAYFDFGGPEPRAKSTAFPKERCWACHNQHAADDNVFTQFYAVLRAR